MVSCFFLPHSPTSPDINAPDLSSGLRSRVGKGRGERLINISTARLLGGLIHTFPMFHPPPPYSHPSLFHMCEGSPVLSSESTWLMAGGILSLEMERGFWMEKGFSFPCCQGDHPPPWAQETELVTQARVSWIFNDSQVQGLGPVEGLVLLSSCRTCLPFLVFPDHLCS